MQLRNRIVGVEDGHLLVHLPDDQPGQGHPGDGTDELDGGAVMDVSVPDGEFLAFGLVIVEQVDGERAPLHGGGVEVAVVDVQVAGAHSLRS